ncbi:MAG: hypothetical protein HQK65_20560, partial [Desulfamplus sp.]|nr:hypothetical protein [Desulfamplus sp.]
MLYISTKYNDISIFNIALKILDSNPHRVNTVSKLIDKINKSNLPFNIVVENAEKLLQFGLITQVKALLNVIDLAKLYHIDPKKLQETGSQLAVILPYHSDVTILMNFFDLLSEKYKLDDDV